VTRLLGTDAPASGGHPLRQVLAGEVGNHGGEGADLV
jgi:hypothetical protein